MIRMRRTKIRKGEFMAEFDLRYGKGKIHIVVTTENLLGVLLPKRHKKIDNDIRNK